MYTEIWWAKKKLKNNFHIEVFPPLCFKKEKKTQTHDELK